MSRKRCRSRSEFLIAVVRRMPNEMLFFRIFKNILKNRAVVLCICNNDVSKIGLKSLLRCFIVKKIEKCQKS